MTTKAKNRVEPKKAPAPPQGPDTAERLFRWANQRRRPISFVVLGVGLVGATLWFMQSAQARREAFASISLGQARAAVDAGNPQLAISDLSRVVQDFPTTVAGREAVLILARVRVQQGESDLVIGDVRDFLDRGDPRQFEAPAAHMLGVALEQLGRYDEASLAYERAANAIPYGLVRSQHLLDAGRAARLAGNNPRATTLYRRIVDAEVEDDPAVTEARLRIGEIPTR